MTKRRRTLLSVLAIVWLLVGLVQTALGQGLTPTRIRELLIEHDLTVGGELSLGSGGTVGGNFVFEGSTADAYETTFAITDATADRTITFPNSSGTVAFSTSTESQEFEGATADDYETTLYITDPTSDVTVTLPVASGTVVLSSLATNAPDAANSVTGASNKIEFEGATANDYETWITPTDATADRTVTLANASGTVMLSTLATNAPDAANSVTGVSNKLEFEGATANDFETWFTPTDATADRTLTLPDASGTVALTSQGVDMTLTAVADGGNAGVKNEYSGLPRIKLVGGAQGTNPGSQTISLVDDTPDGEFAPVDASVTESADTTYYKHGSKSYGAAFAAGAAATDGFIDAGLGGSASWEDMESVGLLVYSTATWATGDLTLVLTDNGGARTYDIPELTAANVWTWLEIDISDLAAGTGDSIGDVAVLMSAAGETALGAFSMYLDIAYVWDATDEEALGTAVLQDGVLSVVNTESGASLAELTDYIVHYESGSDFLVYITDQSSADIVALIAY
jgi:hypothetical protein